MAGFRTTSTFQRLRIMFRSQINYRKKRKEGKRLNDKFGRRKALTGGVWVDGDGYFYNCLGQRIGKLISDKERAEG